MKMKLYVQLTIIFTISLIGEIISDGLHLPIPGSMIGLLILFLLLQFKLLRMRHVNMVGNFLLANMTILFLPPAVGIMDKFHVIAPYLFPIILTNIMGLNTIRPVKSSLPSAYRKAWPWPCRLLSTMAMKCSFPIRHM